MVSVEVAAGVVERKRVETSDRTTTTTTTTTTTGNRRTGTIESNKNKTRKRSTHRGPQNKLNRRGLWHSKEKRLPLIDTDTNTNTNTDIENRKKAETEIIHRCMALVVLLTYESAREHTTHYH